MPLLNADKCCRKSRQNLSSSCSITEISCVGGRGLSFQMIQKKGSSSRLGELCAHDPPCWRKDISADVVRRLLLSQHQTLRRPNTPAAQAAASNVLPFQFSQGTASEMQGRPSLLAREIESRVEIGQAKRLRWHWSWGPRASLSSGAHRLYGCMHGRET